MFSKTVDDGYEYLWSKGLIHLQKLPMNVSQCNWRNLFAIFFYDWLTETCQAYGFDGFIFKSDRQHVILMAFLCLFRNYAHTVISYLFSIGRNQMSSKDITDTVVKVVYGDAPLRDCFRVVAVKSSSI